MCECVCVGWCMPVVLRQTSLQLRGATGDTRQVWTCKHAHKADSYKRMMVMVIVVNATNHHQRDPSGFCWGKFANKKA